MIQQVQHICDYNNAVRIVIKCSFVKLRHQKINSIVQNNWLLDRFQFNFDSV